MNGLDGFDSATYNLHPNIRFLQGIRYIMATCIIHACIQPVLSTNLLVAGQQRLPRNGGPGTKQVHA